jgi:hypothetical protein
LDSLRFGPLMIIAPFEDHLIIKVTASGPQKPVCPGPIGPGAAMQ